MADHPYLVQRLAARTTEAGDRKGVDRFFRCEYMGSAEFEFGALPQSLREMRAGEVIGPLQVKSGKHVAWYVGPQKNVKIAKEFFTDQLGPRKHRLKEPTYIDQVYGTASHVWEGGVEAIGWWCIDEGLGFALFKDEEQAKNWRTGLAG